MIVVRHIRTQFVDDFFEKEVAVMKKYYSDKMKKNKKLKSKVQNLNKLQRKTKQLIITAYMKKIGSQNLIDQIYY